MINHNLLAERLNAVKNGKPIPKLSINTNGNKEELQKQELRIIPHKSFFISEGYKLFNIISTSILYGFGLKALFSTDWNFLGILGIGLLLNHFLTILLKLFKK